MFPVRKKKTENPKMTLFNFFVLTMKIGKRKTSHYFISYEVNLKRENEEQVATLRTGVGREERCRSLGQLHPPGH